METEKIKHLEKINELLSIREAKKDLLMEIDRLIMKLLPLLDSMPIRWYVRNNGQDDFESVIKYLKNKYNRENLSISINCGVGELHGELCFVPHDVQYSFEITQNEFNYLMNETCFYYKIDDKLYNLDKHKEIYLCNIGVTELKAPKDCKIMYCYNNKLSELIIPDNCEIVNCGGNQLKELIIPEGCVEVHCNNNNLTKLVVPKSCKKLYCQNNNISELIIPDTIKEICYYNNPVEIDIPPNCKVIDN